MQKTLTIRGKRYTAKQIAKLMTDDTMINECDHVIRLNGNKYFATFRNRRDDWAPVCKKEDANAIALMPDDGCFRYSIWLELRSL